MRRLLAAVIASVLALGLLASSVEAQGSFWILVNGALRTNRAISAASAAVGDGAFGAPSITFTSEPTMGWYRGGQFHLTATMNSAIPFDISTTAVNLANNALLGWSSTTAATAAADTTIARAAVGKVTVTSTIGATGPVITAGSATGLTVNDSGQFRTQTYKVTLDKTAFTCAAVTCDVTIGTLQANSWLTNVTASLTQVFACASVCTTSTLSAVLGKGAGGAEYLASLDADAATAVFGDADAELGTLMVRASAIQGGTFTAGTQAIVFRMTSGTGNIGTGAATNFSTGSITIWLTVTVLT